MKSSISANIPTELYEEVQAAIKTEKYTNNTECIIEGLTLLLCNPDQEDIEIKTLLQEKEKEIQNMQNEVNRSKEEIQALQEEVIRSKGEVNRSKEEVNRSKEEVNRSKEEVNRSIEEYIGQIKSLEDKLRNAPAPSELAQMRARYEEREKHNETLKAELNKAERGKQILVADAC